MMVQVRGRILQRSPRRPFVFELRPTRRSYSCSGPFRRHSRAIGQALDGLGHAWAGFDHNWVGQFRPVGQPQAGLAHTCVGFDSPTSGQSCTTASLMPGKMHACALSRCCRRDPRLCALLPASAQGQDLRCRHFSIHARNHLQTARSQRARMCKHLATRGKRALSCPWNCLASAGQRPTQTRAISSKILMATAQGWYAQMDKITTAGSTNLGPKFALIGQSLVELNHLWARFDQSLSNVFVWHRPSFGRTRSNVFWGRQIWTKLDHMWAGLGHAWTTFLLGSASIGPISTNMCCAGPKCF